MAGAARDRLRHARRSLRARGLRSIRQDGLRPGAPEPAPFRVARRRARRPLRVPAFAVLGPHAPERRLPRGPPARARRADAGARGGGDDAPPRRPAAARPRRSTRRADTARRGCRPRGIHAALRLRSRGAARRRALAPGHPRARVGDASRRRATRLERARRLAVPGGSRRGARACGGAPLVAGRGRTDRGDRLAARPHTPLRDRVRARARRRKPAATRARVAVPGRRRAA